MDVIVGEGVIVGVGLCEGAGGGGVGQVLNTHGAATPIATFGSPNGELPQTYKVVADWTIPTKGVPSHCV